MAARAGQSVVLPAIVDLDSLDRVRDELIAAGEFGPVHVDGSGVERVATNALLMLLSAGETARTDDSTLFIDSMSNSMISAIERLGLASRFEEFSNQEAT